jgi:hypothetical protein
MKKTPKSMRRISAGMSSNGARASTSRSAGRPARTASARKRSWSSRVTISAFMRSNRADNHARYDSVSSRRYQLLKVPTQPITSAPSIPSSRRRRSLSADPAGAGWKRSRSAHVGITTTGTPARTSPSLGNSRTPAAVSDTIASASAKNRRSHHLPARNSSPPAGQ